MALNAGYALAEFYLSLIAYFILHMIFVISSDFVEAFSIPPLNIGIYVDKMAAIRALLMVLADFFEWGITQKGFHDPGGFKTLLQPSPRRIGSILSFIGMLICRIVYLYLIYFSDNKSLSVFITLCLEGFWFGVFQMSFFAIGPEYNAFTSFGIHTMGNFIFFLQLILQNRAKKKPKINSLYRVRVHGWIVVITSVIALFIWGWLCNSYTLSFPPGSDEFRELVDELKAVSVTTNTADKIAEKLASAVKDGTKLSALVGKLNNPGGINSKTNLTTDKLKTAIHTQEDVKNAIADLVKVMYGAEVNNPTNSNITANEDSNINNKLKVELRDAGSTGIANGDGQVKLEFQSNNQNKGVRIEIKIKDGKTGSLVKKSDDPQGNNNAAATEITRRIAKAANKATISSTYNPGQELVKKEFNLSGANVTADGSNKQVTVSANEPGGNESKTSTVSVQKLNANEQPDGSPANIKIQVNSAKSKGQANRIGKKLASALTQVKSVTESGSSTIKINVNDITVKTHDAMSPLLLFIVGAFAEDFAVPGVLPFAFLDPEKANLINYLTPVFFMTGAWVIVLLNDFFSENGFAKNLGDSWFKDWSEGGVDEWHCLWLLNIPKYLAFFIAMWSIHGTFSSLRCIIQSRWRVLILTMTIVVPRATLEVAGYVGVANYSIASHDFDMIAWHDILAMFCRFVYGKFAVGYNWTRVSLGYCLPKFRPRHKGFGFGFWWWVGRTLSRAWADTVKDFKADIKCYL